MVVQHNISAMTANRYYTNNNSALARSMEKLSSGLAINRAGDNAAGLAVSEKMRAQISGLTQASKNAQDGISMVQTFEGALQETDSILQRMRTIAVQSANGSYANEVDREALQLEFDQLNDELNQIADTDFNGVVVLNGGKMADGLEAVDGKIDYKTVRSDAKQELLDKLNELYTAADSEATTAEGEAETAATAAATSPAYDITEDTATGVWNTVDNSAFDKTVADDLWTDLGLTSMGTVSVNFENTNGTWAAASGTFTDEAGNETELSSEQLGKFNVAQTANGGFTVTGTTGTHDAGSLGNAILNETDVANGSTVTLDYKNSTPTTYAPTNIGFVVDTNVPDNTTTASDIGAASVKLGTDGTDGVTDANMTQGLADLFTALDGAEITGTYGANTLSFTSGGTALTNNTVNTINGKSFFVEIATNAVKIKDTNVAGTGAGSNTLATITFGAANADTAGTNSVTLALDAFNYDSSSSVGISKGNNPNLGTKSEEQTALNDAKSTAEGNATTLRGKADALKAEIDQFDAMDETEADNWKQISERLASAKKELGEEDADSGASTSNAFANSTTSLTYAEDMKLQVGARSKDIVTFNFNYSANGIGKLEADMNCSAEGLGTASLKVSDQENANASIDKIDNAINKVSMVRATFGAIQNRLEHKISNLDTNAENLTAAESRIRDTQMDQEMMKFTSAQILSQASQSMLAQANSLPQGVLQLLG